MKSVSLILHGKTYGLEHISMYFLRHIKHETRSQTVSENDDLEKAKIHHFGDQHARTKTKNDRKLVCSTYPILMTH